MKLTRRQLVVAAAGSAFAVNAAAQSALTGPGSPDAPADFAKQARDSVQSNVDALAKFAIPMATEPAFQFKA